MELMRTTYAYACSVPMPAEWDQGRTIEQIIQGLYPDEETLGKWSHTLIEGDLVMAVMGLRPHWEGVAEAWSFISDEAKARPLSLVRATRASLEDAAPRLGIKRVQAVGDARDEKLPRWFKALKFECEGRLRCYGMNGEGDHFMYARIF